MDLSQHYLILLFRQGSTEGTERSKLPELLNCQKHFPEDHNVFDELKTKSELNCMQYHNLFHTSWNMLKLHKNGRFQNKEVIDLINSFITITKCHWLSLEICSMFSLIFTHFTKLAAIIIHKWFIVFLLKMLEGCNKGLLKRCTIYFTPLHRLYHWWLLQSYGRDIQISKQDFRSEPIQNLTKKFSRVPNSKRFVFPLTNKANSQTKKMQGNSW